MLYAIFGSGEQKSIFSSIGVHFKTIFYANLKEIALSGGDTKINKILPMC